MSRTGVKAAERRDRKFVVHTNDDTLSADGMALGYRQLQRVEQAWQQMKSGLGLRPIHRHAERRIRVHIALTVLALLLARMVGDRWHAIRHELGGIKLSNCWGPPGRSGRSPSCLGTRLSVLRHSR
ncbi:MAG: transposase [Gammaproteobacteria bacterium]|nr:transposase [Gammaproteobacteria bacterium]MDE0246751.1 transposase [Gammaproteobacteria bacterium]